MKARYRQLSLSRPRAVAVGLKHLKSKASRQLAMLVVVVEAVRVGKNSKRHRLLAHRVADVVVVARKPV